MKNSPSPYFSPYSLLLPEVAKGGLWPHGTQFEASGLQYQDQLFGLASKSSRTRPPGASPARSLPLTLGRVPSTPRLCPFVCTISFTFKASSDPHWVAPNELFPIFQDELKCPLVCQIILVVGRVCRSLPWVPCHLLRGIVIYVFCFLSSFLCRQFLESRASLFLRCLEEFPNTL